MNELRAEIKRKWSILYKARQMGAEPKALIAIRNKIYEDQDKLVEEMVKNKIEGKVSDYWIKNRFEIDEEQTKLLDKYYDKVVENIDELEETEF